MKKVGIAILKDKLSAYLSKVKKGGRFLVTDRGVPVAKLVPLTDRESDVSAEEALAEMIASGLVTPPTDSSRTPCHEKIDLGGGNTAAELIRDERDTW
jgi:prevent-host-death family protein